MVLLAINFDISLTRFVLVHGNFPEGDWRLIRDS